MAKESENPIITELVKANVTDAVIQKLRTEFLPLKINGIDDKEGYEKVHKARIQCRDVRVLTEKICKKGREDAVKIQKEWITKEKEVVAKVSEVEGHLKKQEDAIDAEKEAIKIKQERLLKLPGRKEQIVGVESYFAIELNDEVIMGFDDPTWGNLVLMAKQKKIDEFEEKERIRKNQERQEILANRTNLLMLAGAQIKIINGVRTFVKGMHKTEEDRIVELHPEAFEFEREVFEKTDIPDAPPEVKKYPATPSGAFPVTAKIQEEGSKLAEISDEEKLWNYANAIENIPLPEMKETEGYEVLKKAGLLIKEAINILRK
jgi:hypothetical protein